MFPEARFILADSIRKKITVVNEVIRETRLTNCETRNMRLEDIHDKADFVVSRAVAEISQLYGWTRKNIVPGGKNALKNGLLALKGGDLSSEISFDKIGKIYDLKDYYDEPFFESKKLVYVPA
jgi:16S rRNA (guanine527-N7)-methyltransferase